MKINLDTYAAFSWDFGQNFLVEVGGKDSRGDPLPDCDKYIWSDPEYGGDNTIRLLPEEEYLNMVREYNKNGMFWRWKGWHVIREYCGPDIKFVEE